MTCNVPPNKHCGCYQQPHKRVYHKRMNSKRKRKRHHNHKRDHAHLFHCRIRHIRGITYTWLIHKSTSFTVMRKEIPRPRNADRNQHSEITPLLSGPPHSYCQRPNGDNQAYQQFRERVSFRHYNTSSLAAL